MFKTELTDDELSRELSAFEEGHGMSSEEFYTAWSRGEIEDHDLMKWAVLCNEALFRAANRVPSAAG